MLHFIWLGAKPLPKDFTDIYEPQWRDHHPDYLLKTWTEKDIEDLEFSNREIILDKKLNPGLRADALRLELLHTWGGVYVDIDVACVKSIEPLRQLRTDFVIGVSNTKAFELNNAVIMSCKDNLLLAHLVEKLKESF